MNKRVVVTGMSVITPIGSEWHEIEKNLKEQRNGVIYMPEWEVYTGLNTKLAAPVKDFQTPEYYTRRQTRSMGRVALLSSVSAERALKHANLLDNPVIQSGKTGVAYGSSSGSIDAALEFYSMLKSHIVQGINATTYIRMMGHTCAVNIGLMFGCTGRFIQSGSACTSGSLAIGYAYETIKNGYQKVMFAGGAEELNPTQAAIFDTLYATSTRNKEAHLTPRPFDANRDGLVIGEGSGTLILEELEHAKERGANILAEIVGFGTNTDGQHITQPNKNTIKKALEFALLDAKLTPDKIGYINAHGTATKHGDITETHATYEIFGSQTPISSQKSYIGHTLGACGAIESIFTIQMMNNNWYVPNLNLENIDPECAKLDYIKKDLRYLDNEYVMSNNFAFGGINTSLIFQRWRESK